MTEHEPTPATFPPLLTMGEAAAMLGCSTRTVRRAADRGELEVHRTLGGQRRVTLASVEARLAELHP